MTDEDLRPRITHIDLDDLLDNVPKISTSVVRSAQRKSKGPRTPTDKCVQVFLEWHKGRRMPRIERREAGLLAQQIAERHKISKLLVDNIGHRRAHWDRIKPVIAQMVALGKADFLLQPMFKG